ncbi:phage holin family protein [Nocardia panacis]|uniref:Phage holin family protein n=1 Tax=Nocardia panacis TaxID=2340916 RepID=A0A3A4K9R3_9NOCA|nr:phage holin family protein [Nocardia panacis]RJO76530.1 phage holin family protein [Nocardia panacis]
MTLVLRLIINGVAIWLAAAWVHKIEILSPVDRGTGVKILVVLGIALVFTIVNALVKPIVRILSLPLVVVSLGLFLLVINALMLLLTAKITEAVSNEYGLRVEGFWTAIIGAVIISVVNWVLELLIPDRR